MEDGMAKDFNAMVEEIACFLENASLDDLKILHGALRSRLCVSFNIPFPQAHTGYCDGNFVSACSGHAVIFDELQDPSRKLSVIKEIRLLTGLGLVAAKNISEAHKAVVAIGLSFDRAMVMKNRLEIAGAVIRVINVGDPK
jgi:ribosomal protein L7/L12